MDTTLQSTSVIWWSNHCNSLTRWDEVAAALKARFKEEEEPRSKDRYQGESNPKSHLEKCEAQWRTDGYPEELWVHRFIHSLAINPHAWYLTEEKRRGTNKWQEVAENSHSVSCLKERKSQLHRRCGPSGRYCSSQTTNRWTGSQFNTRVSNKRWC